MGRSTKPRKAYRPGRVNPLAMLAAFQGSALLTLDDRLAWQSELHEALTAVSRGQAKKAQWASLFDAINLTEELCRMRLATDADGVVPAAQDAVCAVLDRQQASGVRAVRATELQALRDLVAAFADLMAGITHKDKYEAETRVAERVRRVLAKPAQREGVRVFDAAQY